MDIADRLQRVRQRIMEAAEGVGRDPGTVRLVAVSKYIPAERIRAAVAAGITVLGENRVQEARNKIEGGAWPGTLRWHLIGHLQSNKAAAAARLFDMIESVDSVGLARTLDRHAGAAGRVLPVLLQVRIGGETTKAGFEPDDLPGAAAAVTALPNLRLEGLMAIPPYREDPEASREDFRRLRGLRDALAPRHPGLRELSMGMSHDFGVAVEEGATIVRVGTAIFGERKTA